MSRCFPLGERSLGKDGDVAFEESEGQNLVVKEGRS